MKIKFLFLFLILTNTIQSFAGGPYKIKKMYPPGKKVLIGGEYLKEKDIFYSNQIIRWDKTLKNQAIIAYDIKMPSQIIYFTKRRAKYKDIEVSSYIASLMGKGSNDTLVLGPDEPLQFKIEEDSLCQYKMHIMGSFDFIDVPVQNNYLVLSYDMFSSCHDDAVEIEVIKVKDYDLKTVLRREIEIVR